jgi:DNA transposition AAA+ family ATPase
MNTNQAISEEKKQQITADLRTYVDRMAGGSANKASKMLKKVSNGYISLMLNGKWEAISDEAWRNVANQVSPKEAWQFVHTKSSTTLFRLLDDSRHYANCFGILANEGRGKTFGASTYAMENGNVFLVRCNEFDTKKTFLMELMRVMGLEPHGWSIADMMRTIVHTIMRMENPVIIWDEADKPSDNVLYFFISFYNMLEDKCGLVMMGTPHLMARIERGVRLNRKGFRELWSRLGRKWINLPEVSTAEVAEICQVNGVYETMDQQRIFNESEGDLRRVKRLVHASKRRAS